jgi:hypothetical protein
MLCAVLPPFFSDVPDRFSTTTHYSSLGNGEHGSGRPCIDTHIYNQFEGYFSGRLVAAFLCKNEKHVAKSGYIIKG